MRLSEGIALAAALSLPVSSIAAAAPAAGAPVAPTLPDAPVVPVAAPDETAAETTGDTTPEQPEEPAPEPPAEDPADAMFKARVQEAAKHYTEGRALYSEGRYAESAAEFERSHAAIEFGDTLFKIIEAYEKANEPIRALRKAREYLALASCEGGRESPANYPCGEPEQRTEALRRSERLRRRVAEVKLQLGPGADLREIKVADRIVPSTDFPVLVPPGTFVMELTGPNDGDFRRHDVTVEAGDTFTLFVPAFVAAPDIDDGGGDDDGTTDPGFDPRRRKRILRGAFWGSLSLTVASGIATGVLIGLTRFNTRRFNELKCSAECTVDEYNDLPMNPSLPEDMRFPLSYREAAERQEPARNAMIGVTAGLGAITVVLGIFAYAKKPSRANANARLQVRAGGLSVRW